MSTVADTNLKRVEQIEFVSGQLLSRAALLTRLLTKRLDGDLTRTEAGVLNTLDAGPRRVTELAELEGLAQPTMTLLVKELEKHGLVRRERQARDGRVVLVSVTDSGRVALERFRAETQIALRSYLAEMSDDQVEALSTTAEALQSLIVLLQRSAVG
ncbi:MAG TPA: MarR family transcriptional regulator [Solirubrobacteraceae bacterium]|jgi:DNA-binding MarR family transcriptional regulator|nr:MarR family transcriptional regulator [Solirubrobacteraceae bacterium]